MIKLSVSGEVRSKKFAGQDDFDSACKACEASIGVCLHQGNLTFVFEVPRHKPLNGEGEARSWLASFAFCVILGHKLWPNYSLP